MAKAFKLQDPGEGIREAEVREVSVSSGDRVNEGDPLLAVETDKAVNEIDSPFTGTIESVKVETGQQIKVGDVLLTYEPEGKESGEEESGKKAEGEEQEAEASGEEKSKDREETESASEESGEEAPEESEEEQETEKAQAEEKKAAESTGEADKQKPKGKPKGKRKKTLQKAEEGKAEKEKQDKRGDRQKAAEKSRPVPAAPATRRLAREQGIDLQQVEGSGPGGRVTAEDLRAHAEGGEKTTGRKSAELPDFGQWGEVERKPFRSVRRATARQMSLAWEKIPHVMHREMADVTELEAFRRRYKREIEDKGGKLTLTVLLMKALTAALREYPDFNASLDEENGEIIVKQYHHIGVAVSTEQGLLVPVVRDVDRKSVTELAVELTALAERTRQGKIEREEMRGGSFTITNPGPIGGDSFTPIINYPEAAILGVGSARLEPVITGDMENYQLTPRLRVPLCLVYDHRLNDGANAARFLHRIVETLHDPQSFLLNV